MIKLENFEVVGWEHAIRGMRNPMNSWEKSDSWYCCEAYPKCHTDCQHINEEACDCQHVNGYILGQNDQELALKLSRAGPVHGKFRRMIVVYVDITAPLYWWKEFDTYKVGTVANSCSTMHKITDKEFSLEDFSCEHLIGACDEYCDEYDLLLDVSSEQDGTELFSPRGQFFQTVRMLNICRDAYLKAKVKPMKSEEARKELLKKIWWQMIQLLPSSYNQKRTVMLSYEVLANMYEYRKNHKLDEWVEFCKWIETLPYSEIITGK